MSFRLRGLLLLAAGALLIAQRAKLLPVPWSEAIWPILGSMFMFRLIVYFYDLRHDKAPVTPAQSLSYFFMLPNACFPLFPVIDFKTYRRSHYSADAYLTYQKGVDWILRGIVHLILYRYIYYHVTLAPSEVTAPAQFLQYLVSNFLLYLRVSGLFHLVVGMLYLFGFRPARDAPPLPARRELHRLLAPHQHLLERLHAEDLLLSIGIRVEAPGHQQCHHRRDDDTSSC